MSTHITTQTISYQTDSGLTLKSLLALPSNAADAAEESLAAVLVAPEWWGLSEHPQNMAKKLAEAGYVALAMDVYGEGKITTAASQANEWMTEALSDMDELMARAALAYEQLHALPVVNGNHIAAIGFCLGGKIVLDMARSGMELNVVASFHGNPAPMQPAEKGVFKPEVLFAHGELDSMVSLEAVDGFKQEMDNAGVTYTVNIHQGAKHGFTNPAVDKRAEENGIDLKYNQQAAEESWQNMLDLFARTLG